MGILEAEGIEQKRDNRRPSYWVDSRPQAAAQELRQIQVMCCMLWANQGSMGHEPRLGVHSKKHPQKLEATALGVGLSVH